VIRSLPNTLFLIMVSLTKPLTFRLHPNNHHPIKIRTNNIKQTGCKKNNTTGAPGVGLNNAITMFVAHTLTQRSKRFSSVLRRAVISSSVILSSLWYQPDESLELLRLWRMLGRIVDVEDVEEEREGVREGDGRRVMRVGVEAWDWRVMVIVVVIDMVGLARCLCRRKRSRGRCGGVWPLRRRERVFIRRCQAELLWLTAVGIDQRIASVVRFDPINDTIVSINRSAEYNHSTISKDSMCTTKEGVGSLHIHNPSQKPSHSTRHFQRLPLHPNPTRSTYVRQTINALHSSAVSAAYE